MSLQKYFTEAAAHGVIDHTVRAHVREDGLVGFYIHPAHGDGTTADFVTYDATVVPLGAPASPVETVQAAHLQSHLSAKVL